MPKHARPRPPRLRRTGGVLLAAGTVSGVAVTGSPASAASAPSLYAHTSPDTAVGGALTDTAIVSGRTNAQRGATVTFLLYGPLDATCGLLPLFVDTQPLPPGTTTVTSDPYEPLLPGTYRWVARYSGDANNAPLASSCSSAGQSARVTLTPGPALLCRGLDVTIAGTDGADLLRGTPGDDVILARGGNDAIYGGGGDDTICSGGGDDTVRGGPGDDTLLGGRGSDTLSGTSGHDTVRGGSGDDTLHGQRGNDTMQGFDGDDVLRGGSGDDDLDGGDDVDTLRGGDGRDHGHGGLGRDTVLGCERVD